MQAIAMRILCAAVLVQVPGVASALEPSDVLERYMANADRAISWRLSCNSVQESLMGNDPNGLDRGYRASDIRSDGDRVFWRWLQWGGVVAAADFVPQERATYHSFVWDGKSFSTYAAKSRSEEGILHLDPNPNPRQADSMRCLNAVAPLFGYYPNAYARVDHIVREARAVFLRKETESVNGAECLVIEARTDDGDYTLWIDPKRGYNIVKAEIHATQEGKHRYLGQPMKGPRWRFQIEIQRFQEFDGVWVATEGTLEEFHELPRWDNYRTKSHIEVTELILNPDHEALRSFERDDIGDGTWGWTAPYSHIKQVWQQGDFVPVFDAETVAKIDRTVAMLWPEQQELPLARATTGTLSGASSGASEREDVSSIQPESEMAQTEAGTDASALEEEQTPAESKTSRAKYPHCGLYCVYTMIGMLGREVDFRDLVKPEYIASPEGSSLMELRRAALDFGVHAEPVGRLTKRGLQCCPYPAILHVRSHAASPKYDHYELFLGTEKDRVRLYSPPEAPRLVEFRDLMPRWDGRALFVSDSPIDSAAILTADRQRWLLYGMIGVLVVLAAHVGQRIWLSIAGRVPRGWSLGLSVGQAMVLGLAALLCGGFYHFAYDEGLLANATATQALQKGHTEDFIPKLSARKVRRLLGTEVLFVDARLADDYERGHLDNAISLPIDANDAVWEATVATIPQRAPIVAYCQSARCQFAEKISLRLKEEGYRDVAIFKGGWVEWVERYDPPESASQSL